MSLCRALSGGLFWWPFLVTVISYCVLHKLNEWMFDTPSAFPPHFVLAGFGGKLVGWVALVWVHFSCTFCFLFFHGVQLGNWGWA